MVNPSSTNLRTPVDFADKLKKVSEYWSPRVVAEMNDYQFKIVKIHGDFIWHNHKDTDEAFLVLKGDMEIGFRDGAVNVREGQMFVVPRGVEHITRASNECHVLVIEPRGTVNTGDAGGVFTAEGDLWA